MRFRLVLLGILIGLSIHSSVPAQRTPVHPISLQVHGQVRYAETRNPAANIIVRMESINGGMVGQLLTDREGNFSFPD